jgi:ABC-type branched-subunit amino acid transport system permease subunit
MDNPLRNGLRAGAIFSVIIVFLQLIGFPVVGSNLIGKVLGNAPAASAGQAALTNMAIFMGLLGLWNGSTAAKRTYPDTFAKALISGLTAGLFAGVIVGVFAYLLGLLQTGGVDVRRYLSSVSPDVIRLFLFNQAPMTASLYHFAILVVMGTLGGLFARGFGRGAWRQTVGKRIDGLTSRAKLGQVQRFLGNRYAQYALFLVVAVILFIVPRQWGSYWNYIMGTVGIYVILGLGLNIIVGLAGQLVLGYVAFFAIGAYTVALLTAPEPHHLNYSFWVALPIGIILAAFAGILIGLPILRLRGDYLAIVTLGFGEIIRILLRSDLLTSFSAGPQGVRNIAGPTLFGKSFSSDIDFMYLIILAVLLCIFIANRLQNSRVGRSWNAIREDETVARASGINTFSSKMLALALGAAFAGLAGVLFASRNQFTGPEDHGLLVSINVLCLIIVGGMGSIPGVILGSFALKGLPEILRELENYRLLAFGALLVVMMIIRPEGLWPARRPKLEGRQPQERKTPVPEMPPGAEKPGVEV